ncbi:hypothetical protein PspLS_06912 [Pyricularia sp. CBS 133598]|nr:hypothetical protein PspLS_06912 [Pyricularia sp. CBS 133598]
MPVYYLCASLDIPPPLNGRLHLGSILANVGTTTRGVSPDQPLNFTNRIGTPASEAADWVSDKGFAATASELRKEPGGSRSGSGSSNIWAGLLSKDGPAAAIGRGELKWLSKNKDDDLLVVDGVRTLEFAPSREYLSKTLDHDAVLRYLQLTRGEKPLYVITGLKVVVGAVLVRKGAERGELGVDVPAQAESGDGGDTDPFGGQKAFVLGYRTLRMTWAAKDEMGSRTQKSEVLDMENWKIEEGVVGSGEVVDHDGGYGIEPSTWIFPITVHRGTGSFLQAAAQSLGMTGAINF